MVDVVKMYTIWMAMCIFFFQAEDGIRDLVRSRGLGDVYKRQHQFHHSQTRPPFPRFLAKGFSFDQTP